MWQKVLPLMRAAFCDVNPIPIKYAMAELGLCRPYLRLPLVPLDETKRASVKAALELIREKHGD